MSHLVREAMKNVFGRRSRLFPYAAAALLSSTFVVLALLAQSIDFDHEITAAHDKGRNIFTVQSSSSDRPVVITRESCERLTGEAAVVRAGIITDRGRKNAQPLGSSLPLVAVSPTLLPQVDQGRAVVGVALHPSGAESNIVIDGVVLRAVSGLREPAGIDVNSAIAIPLGVDVVDDPRCVIEMKWNADGDDLQLALNQLHVQGGPIIAVPVFAETTSLIGGFLARSERWLPILVGCLGGLATSLAIRTRRTELAAYVFAGATRSAVATLVSLECILIGGVAAFGGVLTTLTLAPFALSPASQMFAMVAMGATWIASALPVSLQVAVVSPVELGKRR